MRNDSVEEFMLKAVQNLKKITHLKSSCESTAKTAKHAKFRK
jgi:hypothetical protein